MPIVDKIFADRLSQARREAGLQQDDLADALDTTKATISRYENFVTKRIKITTINKLAQVLNVNPDWLLGKSDNKTFTNRTDLFLNDDESEILEVYRSLNKSGKDQALLQLEGLSLNDRFKLNNETEAQSKVIGFHSPPHPQDYVPVNPKNGDYDLAAAHDDIIDDGLTDEEIAELDRLDLEEMDRIDRELHKQDN